MNVMPRHFTPFLLLLLLAVGACTGLKPLTPLAPLAPLEAARKTTVLEGCRRPFLPGKYRLVHALEMVTPGGAKGTAIGVLVADPPHTTLPPLGGGWEGGFRTVLMTVEGFVLFDVEAGETLTLHRAVPPFDKPAFAEGLAEDIRLAFFAPGGEPTTWGTGEEGAPACRFERADGRLVEVLTFRDGVTAIRLYGAGQELLKKVKITPAEGLGPAELVEIESGGWPSYTLRLRLLESEELRDE